MFNLWLGMTTSVWGLVFFFASFVVTSLHFNSLNNKTPRKDPATLKKYFCQGRSREVSAHLLLGYDFMIAGGYHE